MTGATAVIENPKDEVIEQPVAAETPTPEFDEDAEFAKQAAEADARLRARGEDIGTPVGRGSKEPEAPAAPASAATPEEKAPAAPAPVVNPDDALLAAVPEEQRPALAARLKAASDLEAENRRLANDNRSIAGRISAYQRKYEEATGLRQPEAPKTVSPEDEKAWQQFATDYPDIAKAFEARLKTTLPAGADPTVQELAAYVENEKRERFLHQAYDAVEAVHPGWRQLGGTKEFQEWKSSSTTYEKLAASDDVADAVALFDLYKARHPAAPQPTIDPKEVAASQALAARRGAQVEGAKSQRTGKATPNQNVDLNDPDQLWAFYAEKSNNRIKGRYQ